MGLFTSPHLEAYEERFQINGGAQVERGLLARLVKQAEQAIDRVEAAHPDLGGDVTEFELATAVGFLCFRHAAVDIVI